MRLVGEPGADGGLGGAVSLLKQHPGAGHPVLGEPGVRRHAYLPPE